MLTVFLTVRTECHTCFQGFFQAVVIGPVLWVPLLQTAVNFCCLVQTLQLQQQLSCKNMAVRLRSKVTRMRRDRERRASERDLATAPAVTHLVSPPRPACRRSASRSWTGAPGPPCTDLLPAAPGSGKAAARCTRSPLCRETSEQTKRVKSTFSAERQWLGGWVDLCVCALQETHFFSAQLSRYTSFLYYTNGTKTGSRLVLSGAGQRTGAATDAAGPFWQPLVSKFPSNKVVS